MATTLYGASDDLIELDGDVSEEFDAYRAEADGTLVTFSNGVVLRITYNHDGIWRIVPVVNPEGSTLTIEQAPENDDDNYSDRATIEMPIRWAVCRNTIVHARGVGQVLAIAGAAGVGAVVEGSRP